MPVNVEPVVVLIVKVSDGDSVIVTLFPAFKVILFCLLFDNEFKREMRYDMLLISRGISGMDNVVVDT